MTGGKQAGFARVSQAQTSSRKIESIQDTIRMEGEEETKNSQSHNFFKIIVVFSNNPTFSICPGYDF